MLKEKMTVARAMVKCLQKEGTGVVFGYPGATICPFFDELDAAGMKLVLVRHEANAGHAASGYARITGKPAVCSATSGPGATNLITAVATAYMDSIPMVIITGQVNSELIGRDAFQEADITGACEPFVKHSYLVKDAARIPEIMKKAFYIAGSGRPGPVLVDVPLDVQNTEIDFEYPEKVEMRTYKPNISGNKLQVKKAAAALEKAERPLICAGGGLFVSGAEEEMVRLSELCNIPVISTMMGIGTIPTEHENYFGMLGMYGTKTGNYALKKCDLLIILGARVGDRAVKMLDSLTDTVVIHLDIDPAEIGKNIPVNIPVVGDVKTVLKQLLAEATAEKHDEWLEELRDLKKRELAAPLKLRNGSVNPALFIRRLSEKLPDSSCVCADVGQNQIWTAANLSLNGGRLLTSGGMGTMGYGLPAAVGAKLAAPETTVVCVCGDGGFQMSMMELATAVQQGLDIKIAVIVNRTLGMIRELQQSRYGGRYTAVELGDKPDFIKLAEAYGIKGEAVSDNDAIDGAVKRMLEEKKTYILQINVDCDENAMTD